MYVKERCWLKGKAKVSKSKKKVAKKSEVGKELEEKIKASKAKFSKSQQEILKQMKEKKDSEFNVKLTDSLARAFNTETENGVTIIDEVAAKVAADFKEATYIPVKELVKLREALGENKQQLDVEVGGKINLQEELKKLASEDEWS